jgi:hypothetical protein
MTLVAARVICSRWPYLRGQLVVFIYERQS